MSDCPIVQAAQGRLRSACAHADYKLHITEQHRPQVIEMNDGVIQNVNASRLKLCESTAQVMAKGFDILGLRYVPRM